MTPERVSLLASALKRVAAVELVTKLRAAGGEAVLAVIYAAKHFDVSTSTIWRWLARVEGEPRTEWLALLTRRAGAGA